MFLNGMIRDEQDNQFFVIEEDTLTARSGPSPYSNSILKRHRIAPKHLRKIEFKQKTLEVMDKRDLKNHWTDYFYDKLKEPNLGVGQAYP